MIVTRCKSCNELIFFAETVQGRKLPLDAKAAPVGGVYVSADRRKVFLCDSEVPRGQRILSARYLTHFETCAARRGKRRAEIEKGDIVVTAAGRRGRFTYAGSSAGCVVHWEDTDREEWCDRESLRRVT